MHLLYLTSEQWPTYRVDLTVLFGKYLPRFGLTCDLVTEQENGFDKGDMTLWPAGEAVLCKKPKSRAKQYLLKFFHQSKVLLTADYQRYDAVQVRDMVLIALVAIIVCKLHKKPFYYWLSYPQSEGQIQRAQARGLSAGMRYWFPLIQGYIGKFLIYKVILPNAQHVFVQSTKMMDMVSTQGVSVEKMTPVPMGVDIEATRQSIQPSEDPILKDKKILVYLGTLDRVRQIEILFHMMAILRQSIPNALLVLVGDTEDKEHRAWLKSEAKKVGVEDAIHWTSWLPMQEAWRYVVAADIGLSPIPRGYLLDMGSPTKAVEYMALGLSVLMNDNPDQLQVANESNAAICVSLEAESFAEAALKLLNDDEVRAQMRIKGLAYVGQVRSYERLASNLYLTYHKLISKLS
jgi:glycosyltransferase involved in cell wall biosynthesis